MLAPSQCPSCRRPGRVPCARCATTAAPAPGSAAVPAVLAFTGSGRRLLLALKYGNAKPVVAALAGAMARRARRFDVDVVTWAPTSTARRRDRGYDQAEVLARAVAWRLGVPCRRLLTRVGDDARPQTGRTREERLDGPRFAARGSRHVRARTVLVVDDVVTTGATLRAAEAALKAAGANAVHAVVAAATP